MPEGVQSKDLILVPVLGETGIAGATYHAMEFCGETVDEMLSLDSRITIANMVIEAGAKTGFVVSSRH